MYKRAKISNFGYISTDEPHPTHSDPSTKINPKQSKKREKKCFIHHLADRQSSQQLHHTPTKAKQSSTLLASTPHWSFLHNYNQQLSQNPPRSTRNFASKLLQTKQFRLNTSSNPSCSNTTKYNRAQLFEKKFKKLHTSSKEQTKHQYF